MEEHEATELLGVVAAARGEDHQSPKDDPEPESFPLAEVPGAGPVSVRLFGVYAIEVAGEEVRTGLRSKARELLALLLLKPEGVSAEAAVDAVWPDADPARGIEGFRTAAGNLRRTFRDATGQPRTEVVVRVGEHYRLDAGLFDCDLWRFESALAEARGATDEIERPRPPSSA